MNVVTGLISTILSNAFKSTFRLSFASDDKKSVGSSTGVTESKVLVLLCLTMFLGLTFFTTLGRLFRPRDEG